MERPSLLDVPKSEKKFFRRFVKFYAVLLLIFLSFILGLIAGRQTYKVVSDSVDGEKMGVVFNKKAKPDFLSNKVNFNLFWDAWEIIENNYVKQPVNETELFYGAMAGSVAALGDPHSVFFDPDTSKEFTEELKGNFEGIGAEIAVKNDKITIVAPLPDSPAEKAGLLSGDTILAIDGADTSGMSLDFAVSKIRGPKGTEVNLLIGRNGINDPKEYKIIRSKIKIESVKWKMLDNNIAYLELRYFNEDTDAAFKKAVMEIVQKNPQGIILDLRNNPGGFLDTAINVTSEWVENGVVVYEKASDGSLKENKSTGQARLKDFPTVVLINGGSASGSEIVAGALKDYKLATLIGEKSFGKGSVQTIFPLDDGSSIKLTIALWLTPHENLIDGEGILPDIEVKLTPDDFNKDKDPQMDKALEILLKK
ncbi:MAG: S41 family peptidase [Candidatus Parcubacteria bacterium]|nr:S41 family peptidase [Candidatus Parcubacteria bacterium]